MILFLIENIITVVDDYDYETVLFSKNYTHLGYNPRKTLYNRCEVDVINNIGNLDSSVQTISWNNYEKL